MKYRVFLDFDGTITVNDVGYEMFKKFTGEATETIVKKYRSGLINSYVCLQAECEIWNQNPPVHSEVLRFLNGQLLRPGIKEFLEYLCNSDIKFAVLSEGFDFYISHILNYHKFYNLLVISNQATINGNTIQPIFPYYGKGCGECSNCKGFHISRMCGDGEIAVFIGDGHSDIHAAEKSQIVFARSSLALTLGEKNISFIAYEDFFDIIEYFRNNLV